MSAAVEQFCGFRIGKGHYAIPVLSVQEVVKPLPVTPIPLAQKHIRGLINLRGQIVTAVSIRSLFNLDENLDDQHMNVIVKNRDGLFSFVVDEILDVIDIFDDKLATPPETVSGNVKKYLKSVYKNENDLVLLIDVEKIIATL
jgi:purine-binding chemotaxis protein CheW